MAASKWATIAICIFLIAGTAVAARKNKNIQGSKLTTILPKDTTTDEQTTSKPAPTLPPITKCKQAHCSHQCDDVKDIGAVCSCPDDRMYLGKDGVNCYPRSCKSRSKTTAYKCGDGAVCGSSFDYKERKSLPSCDCPRVNFWSVNKEPKIFDKATKSCKRDPRFQTCDWPEKSQCDQGCTVRSKVRGTGTEPVCTCNAGYSLDSSKNKCVVTNRCLIGGRNGGCNHRCTRKSNGDVQCKCNSNAYSLKADGKTCELKSCTGGNSGCQQGCIQIDKRNYYCSCNKGYHLNPDERTCNDYDECSGFHGCDQLCLPDGSWYKCGCRDGYYLADNGFSCRVNLKCENHGCSQHCNPTTGACFCDSTHKLGADGKTCIDIDECVTGKHDCAEKCTNTNGGYACGCNDPRARLSNDLKTCVLDTCEEIDDIQNGLTRCVRSHTDNTMKVGDYCSFTCNKGYKLVGATAVHCLRTGYDVIPPHCADINECDDKLRCGSNERCSNFDGGFNCLCATGYSNVNGKCVDKRGPRVLSCPNDVTLNLPDDADSIVFTWAKPTTYDPTDAPGTLLCTGCPQTEQATLKRGDRTFRYLFADKAGNRALCSFKVKVIDVTKPVFRGCPNGTVFTMPPGVYSTSRFANVTATDNSGSVVMTTDVPSEFDKPGFRTVNYLATDESGNHDSCTYYVNITINECPPLAAPKNGFTGCDDWHVGTVCVPKCKKDYAFAQPPIADKYHCGDDGVWQPNVPIPDCDPVVQPDEAEIKYVAKYRSSTCPNDDPTVKKHIISMAENYFNTSKTVFCFIDDSCQLPSGPQIDCAGEFFSVTLRTDEDYSKVPEHQSMLINFKKKIREEVAKKDTFMYMSIPPLTILKPLVDKNALPVTPEFRLVCPTGAQEIENQCVKG